ncbi:MAG: cob(I)yrinic acid a,c-diamide adenosyltransferase [Deltaproteobacteria bacterium]|jgi:cob(I)alamin adenosyltransferase|nr:cob(I)yrinic acid a,c-diamide adenosyltransferase [Deltaproteobacteria bacterium]
MAFVQVYTGDGKGKTTAAIGLAIRALGAGHKVLFLQFMKDKRYGEHKVLANLSPNLTLETLGKPYFVIKKEHATKELLKKYADSCVIFEPGKPPADYVQMTASGIARAHEAASGGQYNLVVLDELNCALFFELAKWAEVKALITDRSPATELVFTGRNAPPELLALADLVTEFKAVKHYFDQGIEARKGIEM